MNLLIHVSHEKYTQFYNDKMTRAAIIKNIRLFTLTSLVMCLISFAIEFTPPQQSQTHTLTQKKQGEILNKYFINAKFLFFES
jgi:hypothetical protein